MNQNQRGDSQLHFCTPLLTAKKILAFANVANLAMNAHLNNFAPNQSKAQEWNQMSASIVNSSFFISQQMKLVLKFSKLWSPLHNSWQQFCEPEQFCEVLLTQNMLFSPGSPSQLILQHALKCRLCFSLSCSETETSAPKIVAVNCSLKFAAQASLLLAEA